MWSERRSWIDLIEGSLDWRLSCQAARAVVFPDLMSRVAAFTACILYT